MPHIMLQNLLHIGTKQVNYNSPFRIDFSGAILFFSFSVQFLRNLSWFKHHIIPWNGVGRVRVYHHKQQIVIDILQLLLRFYV